MFPNGAGCRFGTEVMTVTCRGEATLATPVGSTQQMGGTMSKKKTTKTAKATKKGTAKKTKAPKDKKLSAIDAAAQVLASAKAPMNAKEMIEAMAAKALWTSPGGKTPHATLYSAIIREIALKGKESRFVKKDRGQFAAKA